MVQTRRTAWERVPFKLEKLRGGNDVFAMMWKYLLFYATRTASSQIPIV